MVTDPVCLVEISENQVKEKAEFRGQTYYFHDERCREVFERDPDEYAGRIAEKVYGDHKDKF